MSETPDIFAHVRDMISQIERRLQAAEHVNEGHRTLEEELDKVRHERDVAVRARDHNRECVDRLTRERDQAREKARVDSEDLERARATIAELKEQSTWVIKRKGKPGKVVSHETPLHERQPDLSLESSQQAGHA